MTKRAIHGLRQEAEFATCLTPAKIRNMIAGGPGLTGRGVGEGETETDWTVVTDLGPQAIQE